MICNCLGATYLFILHPLSSPRECGLTCVWFMKDSSGSGGGGVDMVGDGSLLSIFGFPRSCYMFMLLLEILL